VKERPLPLGQFSTQYARNGPLLAEAVEFTRLVGLGLDKPQRQRLLVGDNRLGRSTYKSRRNIFEALEARFCDHRRAANLGILTQSALPFRAFSMGAFLELAKRDALIRAFLDFLIHGDGMPQSRIEAGRFLQELEARSNTIQKWAPTLRRRAVSALNALPEKFEIFSMQSADHPVTSIAFPVELAAVVVQERLEDDLSPISAPDFAAFRLSRQTIIELLWSCARREWFKVDVIGDIVHVERRFSSIDDMLIPNRAEAVSS
jgi:hypothetical protein